MGFEYQNIAVIFFPITFFTRKFPILLMKPIWGWA